MSARCCAGLGDRTNRDTDGPAGSEEATTVTTGFAPTSAVSRVRGEIDHPIVDGDGHLVEVVPLVADIVGELAGEDMAGRFQQYLRTMFGEGSAYLPVRTPFWGFPGPTVDRLTTALPALMYERLDELGIDFAVLYPGVGLVVMACPDEELRRVSARALNRYYHEVFGPYRDRMTPTAVIPMFTPEEAIDELDHAIGTLGLKCVTMTGVVPRRRADGTMWIDTLGHDSDFDYDPVWARCQELGVVPGFHGHGYGWGSRTSRTNYMYNHLGSFAAAQEAVCRSLVMGGVATRFPDLRFAFLEGGVTWACQLQADLIGHWEKRNAEAILEHDPANLDAALADELVDRYATGLLATRADVVRASTRANPSSDVDRSTIDEFAESGIEGPDDITRIFRDQFFFGCEADDPLNSLAFSPALSSAGTRINAFVGSDIGHWDVSDMRDVLPEAWEQVEEGFMTRDDFRAFTFDNVVRMLTDVNPRFFDDTVIGDTR
jgi:predicted TIM-barrel fold metal-dependent hydrolase